VLGYVLLELSLLVEATSADGAPVVTVDGGVVVAHVALEVSISSVALTADGTDV
jgi:hypothetical protein